MGVKLSSLVEKEPIQFEQMAGKSLAVDFSNFAFQFLSSVRQYDGTPLMDRHGNITSHLVGIWSRFSNLIQKGIRLVVVLDGIPPKEKMRVSELRRERKEEAKKKHEKATEDGDKEMMARYAKQFSFLTREMIGESVNLMEAMGLPVIQAPSEADAQMAYLNKQGDVWATASSDYDCLLHGAPQLITNLTLSQKKKLPSGMIVKTVPEMIKLEKLLNTLKITQDELIYTALLVGTDYNTGVHGIGPKKALKLVQTVKDPDKIFSEAHADFDWKATFNVFKHMEVKKNYHLKWQPINAERVRELLVEKHDFSEERINATLQKFSKNKEQSEQTGLERWK